MASTQHKDLVGDDHHVTKIDEDTGTELTPPSLVILDTRYINEGQAAGGDLSGTFPNPTVVWANAYPTLDGRYYTEAETNALIAAIHSHANKAQLNLITDGDHDVRTDNPHAATKNQVGLGNVDNTSNVNKPISTATQTALNAKVASVHTHLLAAGSTVVTASWLITQPVARVFELT